MKTKSKQLSVLGAPRDLKLIFFSAFFAMLGFGIYASTFPNFAADVVHMTSRQFGPLESIREIPGLVTAFMLALAMRIAEPVLVSGALFMMALGFVGYSQTSTYTPLVFYSLLWSVGLHCWMALQPAMTLALAEDGHKGRRLGQVSACAGLGTATGLAAVLCLGTKVPYPAWYAVTAGSMFVSSIIVWLVRRDLSPPDKPRLVFKRRYWLYYALTFLEGCRKQVFLTFAPWVLVLMYGTELRTIALLMLINNAVNLFGAPFIGRLIDRKGESRVMMVSYSLIVLVYLGYALIHHAYVLFFLYCCDNLLYLSSIGLTSYISRIAEGDDIVPNLSMGITTNHLGAVAVPAIGGLLWAVYGYPVVFYLGAGVVIVSLILTTRMRKKLQVAGRHPER